MLSPATTDRCSKFVIHVIRRLGTRPSPDNDHSFAKFAYHGAFSFCPFLTYTCSTVAVV